MLLRVGVLAYHAGDSGFSLRYRDRRGWGRILHRSLVNQTAVLSWLLWSDKLCLEANWTVSTFELEYSSNKRPVELKAVAHVNGMQSCSNLRRHITPGFQFLFSLQRACTLALGLRGFYHWKAAVQKLRTWLVALGMTAQAPRPGCELLQGRPGLLLCWVPSPELKSWVPRSVQWWWKWRRPPYF